MEPREMDVAMELFCTLTVVNRHGVIIEHRSSGSIAVTSMNTNSTPLEQPFIIVRTFWDNIGTKYNLIGNIEDLTKEDHEFLKERHITIFLKEPSYNIIIINADPVELKAFLVYLHTFLPKDFYTLLPMAAMEPPTHRVPVYLDLFGQEKYKLWMKNIIKTNENLEDFVELKIDDCILELAGYQVPIADAIRKMKNLTTLHLARTELCSSTFLEIESDKLKELHLCRCETPLPIASLFKNDLCYKDSLVELRLEGNPWSEVPNGIFQFPNLLKLSLYNNCITELPDKFINLPKLQDLDLSSNRLTDVPPSIFQIENLLRLSISKNRLTELPENLSDLSKLREFLLCHNQLTHLPPSIFEMQNLRRLSLFNNGITELPDITANSSNLQVLSLSYNRLRHLPPGIFEFRKLSEFSLIGNIITELPNMFAKLPRLKILELSNNQLRHVPPSIFALQHLIKLLLSGNFISELPNVLVNLPKLETLMLCDNQFRDLPPSIFEMQNLSVLSLRGNYIRELPDKFTNLSKLKTLSINNNQLQYIPPSICSLDLKQLDVENNPFNFEIPPSFGSELIVHSLKELSYRTILNHKLKIEEGMLPKKFLKDLANYQQCVCGSKYVDEGQELLFSVYLKNVLSYVRPNPNCYLRVPVRGKMCTSLKSCFLDHFSKYK